MDFFKNIKSMKKMLPGIILLFAGIIATALGFAAAFGEATGFSSIDTWYTQAFAVWDNPELQAHLATAFMGGIAVGSFGAISIFISIYLLLTAKEETFVFWIIVTSIVATILVAVGIAAIVCQGVLNDVQWVKDREPHIGYDQM